MFLIFAMVAIIATAAIEPHVPMAPFIALLPCTCGCISGTAGYTSPRSYTGTQTAGGGRVGIAVKIAKLKRPIIGISLPKFDLQFVQKVIL